MRAMSRVKKLEDATPKCDGRVLRLAPEDHVPSEADRCRMPGHPNPRLRAQCWRSAARFPELDAAMDWLFEIVGRAVEGEPPVTEVEYVELAAWFAAHAAELVAFGPLECEDGRLVWHMNVQYDMTHGPRAIGAGRVAEDVRRLKTAHALRIERQPG